MTDKEAFNQSLKYELMQKRGAITDANDFDEFLNLTCFKDIPAKNIALIQVDFVKDYNNLSFSVMYTDNDNKELYSFKNTMFGKKILPEDAQYILRSYLQRNMKYHNFTESGAFHVKHRGEAAWVFQFADWNNINKFFLFSDFKANVKTLPDFIQLNFNGTTLLCNLLIRSDSAEWFLSMPEVIQKMIFSKVATEEIEL